METKGIKNISLAGRIFAGFIGVVIVFGAVMIYGITQTHRLAAESSRIYDTYLPLIEITARLKARISAEGRETERFSEETNPDTVSQLVFQFRTVDRKKLFLNDLQKADDLINTLLSENSLSHSESETAGILAKTLQELTTNYEEYYAKKNSLFSVAEDKIELTESLQALEEEAQKDESPNNQPSESKNDKPSQEKIAKQNDPEIMRLQKRLNELSTQFITMANAVETAHKKLSKSESRVRLYLRKAQDIAAKNIKDKTDKLTWGLIVFGTLALLLAALLTWITNLTLRPISELSHGVRKLSSGERNVKLLTRLSESASEFVGLAREFDKLSTALEEREQALTLAGERTAQINRDLKKLNTDLITLKRYNENIVNSVNAAIIALDAGLAITYINPAAEKLFKVNKTEAAEKHLQQLLPSVPLFASPEKTARLMASDAPLILDATQIRIQDKDLMVDINIVPLKTAEGEADGLLIIANDVTEKIEMRRRFLQNERLIVMGKVTAQIAHEIRNPLNSINLNVELLADMLKEEHPKEKDNIEKIAKNITSEIVRLAEVTEEFLRFARLPRPEFKKEELNRIVGELVSFFAPELKQRNALLDWHPFEKEIHVEVDANQIRQAILNVLRNGLEAVEESKGKIKLSLIQANGMAAIEIEDNGKGIAKEDIERIFDPFFSTKRSGTGLGLALTRQIISEHGGEISCESKPGYGTKFKIELPIKK